MPVDGSGDVEKLTEPMGQAVWRGAWSPDGKTLVFSMSTVSNEQPDLWTFSLDENDRPNSPQPFLETPFTELNAAFSPDGRWLAYMSDESGRAEVYVMPFSKGEGKWQVSTEGGWHPIWATNTRELFTVPTLDDVGGHTTYDVTADGKRFLVLLPQESDQAPAQLNVVLNWFDELKRLVPTN